MSKPIKIAALIVGAIAALGLVVATYNAIMGDSAETQRRINEAGGATRELQEGQQP